MRIIGKINKIKKDRVEFIPLGVFPEEIRHFKKIKGKKFYLEKNENFEEGKFFALNEEKSMEIIYKNFKKKNKELYFSFERDKYYILLENEFLKVLIDPEKGGKVESLIDKDKNFEWFFDDFSFLDGKLSRCGISQGFKEKSLYEKKLKYRFNKNRFYGKRKEKDFLFEKEIKIEGKKLEFSFSLNFKKEKEVYPFFEIKIFTNGKPYEYSIKYKEDKEIKELPNFSYPFFGGWVYTLDLGFIKEIIVENNNSKIKIKPSQKELINSIYSFGVDYIYFRFFYKKMKRKKIKKEITIIC